MNHKNINSHLITNIVSFVFLGVVVFLSYHALWIGDDITYRFHFGTQEPIHSIFDVFTSQIVHYFIANGRYIGQFLVQVNVALIGQPLFSILNGMVYIMLLFFIARICENSNSKIFIAICLLAFLGFETKFTPSCQINYIWMFLLVTGYLLLFFRFSKPYSKIISFALVPFSIIAGWSNESIVVGISVSLIIYAWQNKQSLTFNQWIMFFCFGIGAALLCLSPATIARVNDVNGQMDFLSPGVYSLIKLCFYLRVTYLLIIYVGYLKIFKKVTWKELYQSESFYIHAFITLLLFNLLIGVIGNRQLFGIELISIILLIKYWKKYNEKSIALNYIICILAISCIYKIGANNTFLQKENTLYHYFYAEYTKSEDGTVFYNLSRDNVTFYETYPSDVFTPYVIGTMDRYFHYLKNDTQKTFKILPVCCENLADTTENYFQNNAEGAWSIIVNKEKVPKRIVQTRNLEILGCNFPFPERQVNESNIVYENNVYKVYQVYDKMPFVKGTGIVFY